MSKSWIKEGYYLRVSSFDKLIISALSPLERMLYMRMLGSGAFYQRKTLGVMRRPTGLGTGSKWGLCLMFLLIYILIYSKAHPNLDSVFLAGTTKKSWAHLPVILNCHLFPPICLLHALALLIYLPEISWLSSICPLRTTPIIFWEDFRTDWEVSLSVHLLNFVLLP